MIFELGECHWEWFNKGYKYVNSYKASTGSSSKAILFLFLQVWSVEQSFLIHVTNQLFVE